MKPYLVDCLSDTLKSLISDEEVMSNLWKFIYDHYPKGTFTDQQLADKLKEQNSDIFKNYAAKDIHYENMVAMVLLEMWDKRMLKSSRGSYYCLNQLENLL